MADIRVAIQEIDALLSDTEGIALGDEIVARDAGEELLLVTSVLDIGERRPHRKCVSIRVFDLDIADLMQSCGTAGIATSSGCVRDG